jgi:hypothetical protein
MENEKDKLSDRSLAIEMNRNTSDLKKRKIIARKNLRLTSIIKRISQGKRNV